MRFNRIGAVIGIMLWPATALAQGTQFPAGTLWGNDTASQRPGKVSTVTLILDRALGSTRGALISRGASGWALIGPGATARLPWLTGGTGADPVLGAYTLPASVTSGGIPCFTSTTAESSSALLTANTLIVGGGAGVCPSSLGAGTSTTVLHGGSPPSYGAVANADMATMAANTTKANATGGSATPTDVAPATARSNSLLNIDQFTGHGDSIYTILATDRTVGTNAAFTASRAWTLPAANAVNAGQEIIVADFQGTVTGTNTIVITRAGSDTINGGTTVTVNVANGAYLLKSDGTSKWTAQALGAQATGTVSLSFFTNSLGADVALNNTANYFDGPSTPQGTSGTWFSSGTVTINVVTLGDNINCKLWDGTTVISSANSGGGGFPANTRLTISLSGPLASPAANIRISCRDPNNTTAVMVFNQSGNSKDSTLTSVKIQ